MKTIKHYNRLLFLFLLLTLNTGLEAQEHTIYASLSNTREINTHYENYISALDAGAVFGINNYIYAGGGLTIAKVWGPDYSSLAAGIGPDLHIHLIRREKFRFMIEGKGRVMYFFPEYPETAINYAFWGGPTAEFSLSARHKLKLGICYNHLSNAKPVEQATNKSLDGIGFNLGWAFY
jgi:hypothetical protein